MLLHILAITAAIAAPDPGGLQPNAVTSFWLAKVDRSASHNVPLYADEGVYALQTFAFALDHWLDDRFALGGALTYAYGFGQAPFLVVIEGRGSTRQHLTEALDLVEMLSVGYAQTSDDFKPNLPSLGLDVGLSIRLNDRVALRTDVGVVRASFAKSDLDIFTDDNGRPDVAEVERKLAISAVRLSVSAVGDF